MLLMAKIHEVARILVGLRSDTDELQDIPDEEALCPMNPDYSCVTCNNLNCPDWGTRFCSCPEHEE